MDDAQFWIYLVFAAFYFISKVLKKKPEVDERPRSPLETEEDAPDSHKTFEELLAEITGQKNLPKKEIRVEPDEEIGYMERPAEPVMDVHREPQDHSSSGNRQFADDESRKVYEDAIRMAEGADIEFEKSTNYKKKLSKRTQSLSAATELRQMMRTKSGARKAVILSEILNRKY